MKNDLLYRINYINNQEIYELYAQQVSTDELLGFISLHGLQFDLDSSVVIDPVEERLKAEFKDVETLHLPIQHVIKIESVKQKKSCKIKALSKNNVVTPLPPTSGPNR